MSHWMELFNVSNNSETEYGYNEEFTYSTEGFRTLQTCEWLSYRALKMSSDGA